MNQREHKYRAWDKEKRKMIHDDGQLDSRAYLIRFNGGVDSLNNILGEDIDMHFEQVILMQYTGLTDKKGVDIYEGDVVKEREDGYPTVVEFTDYGYQGLHEQTGRHERLTTFIEDIEVIGNIYENPELIK